MHGLRWFICRPERLKWCGDTSVGMSASPQATEEIQQTLNLICAQLNVIQARLELKPTIKSSPWLPLAEACPLNTSDASAEKRGVNLGVLPIFRKTRHY